MNNEIKYLIAYFLFIIKYDKHDRTVVILYDQGF